MKEPTRWRYDVLRREQITTVTQLAVLILLIYEPNLNMTEIAQHCGVTPRNITALVDKLTNLGFVEGAYVHNRRSKLVRLTERGRAFLKEANIT